MNNNQRIYQLLHWAVVLAMPFFLGLGTVRAVINWNYPAWEYPRIPADAYGWTAAERLALAEATLAYLQHPGKATAEIGQLATLVDPQTGRPLYNERELGHMVDVKEVADGVRWGAWGATAVVLFGLGGLLSVPAARPWAYLALYRGGAITVAILLTIALFILIAWSLFFRVFHELLFPPGTWQFYYTDALIRLFPEQFWFDVGLILSLTPLFLGLLVAVGGWTLRRRNE